MLKKFKYFILSFILIIPALIPVFFIFTADETRVCGVDDRNYPNANWAKKLDIEVSYDFPCEFPSEETGLFERKEQFEFTGMLLDFFSDNDSAQVLIKNNFDEQNYFANINGVDTIDINQYLPGDQLRIHGVINKNTETILIDNLINLSLEVGGQETINCHIIPTEYSSRVIGCLNDQERLILSYDKNTRFVSGLKNPASMSDFELDDNVRIRIDEDKKIKILVLTKRGNLKYLKNHIFEVEAKLLSIDFGSINVRLNNFPNSINDVSFDKNNLNIKLKTSNNTKVIRKYFGKMKTENFKNGDNLYIIAKINDNGIFEAITIKNNSVWK